jgi:hypothetical protein
MDYADAVATFCAPRPAGTPLPEVVRAAGLEDRTDAAEQAIVAALGDRLDEVCARLDDWSGRCIAAGAFPADIFKRAAG